MMQTCPECSHAVSDQAAACPSCGHPLRARRETTSGKSRGVATVLALLLGGLGLHKFYLNKPGQGVLYLVFCWTFIPSVIGLIEGLSYLFMSNDAFQRKFLDATGHATTAPAPASKRPSQIVWAAIIITALVVIFFS